MSVSTDCGQQKVVKLTDHHHTAHPHHPRQHTTYTLPGQHPFQLQTGTTNQTSIILLSTAIQSIQFYAYIQPSANTHKYTHSTTVAELKIGPNLPQCSCCIDSVSCFTIRRCLLQPYIHACALDAQWHTYTPKSSEYCLNTSTHRERNISWILNMFWRFQSNAYLSVYYVSLLNNWSPSMQSPFVRMNSCASLYLPKGKYTFHGYCQTTQQPRVKYWSMSYLLWGY